MRNTRLEGSWRLTDRIFAPVRLDAPARVCEALTQAGVVREDAGGLDSLKREWLMRRAWRYELMFKMPDLGEKHAFLRLTGLYGAWRARVNGYDALAGDALCAYILLPYRVSAPDDCSADVCADTDVGALCASGLRICAGDDVALEIEFAPERADALHPSAGFEGGAYICEAGDAAILDFKAAPGERVNTRAVLWAARPLTCVLTYALTAPDGDKRKFIARAEFERAGARVFEHAPFDITPPGEPYDIRLEARVSDALTDSSDAGVIAPGREARGFGLPPRGDISLITRAGGDRVVWPDTREHRLRAHDNLLALADECTARALPAPETEPAMRERANGEEYWPTSVPVWALTASSPDAFEGVNARAADILTLVKLSRYRQAIALKAAAEDARRESRPFVLGEAWDARFKYASRAIFDFSGAPRPAYMALKAAWRPAHAYLRAPDTIPEDGITALAVYIARSGDCAAHTVRATGYALNGDERISAYFPVLALPGGMLGRLCVELPGDGLMFVRLCVTDARGEELSRTDELVNARGVPLDDLPLTQILRADDYIQNAGAYIALGVSAADERGGFGCLLPGEKLCLGDARGARVEGVNIYE